MNQFDIQQAIYQTTPSFALLSWNATGCVAVGEIGWFLMEIGFAAALGLGFEGGSLPGGRRGRFTREYVVLKEG